MLDPLSADRPTTPDGSRSAHARLLYISLLAAVTGLLAGFAAYGLYILIALVSNLVFYQRLSFRFASLQSQTLGYLVLVVPAIGGLIVGLMAKYGSSKIRGHGIPEAMEAVLTNHSRIAPRVLILKPLSAAIAIGTGGPFGAEGPIIQTGGALGSFLGQLVHVTSAERKVLLACGAAAGMAATFSTPIAAVIFSIELLLFEFKSRSFIPLVIASTLATAVHRHFLGQGPMFKVAPADFAISSGLPYYLLLGVLCGVFAVGFSRALYWIEDQFERLPFDPLWWPALGGLGLGIIGLYAPVVLGVGYETITAILNNRLSLSALLTILVCKSLALLVSLGSGTSGGLLAPMFMAGAALGGVFAIVIDHLLPGAHLSPAAYALVGMAAVFAAASRATFAFIVFAFEITRNYAAILPLMLVSVIASGLALLFMRNSIMTEKLARRGLRVHQDYEVDAFHRVTVGQAMDPNPPTAAAATPVVELADEIARHDTRWDRHQALVLVDPAGRLQGIVTRGDVLQAIARDRGGTALTVGHAQPVVAYPDETLHTVVDRMLRHHVGRLPVVDRAESTRLLGYLGRSEIFEARRRFLQEEEVREAGWLAHAPWRRHARAPRAPG